MTDMRWQLHVDLLLASGAMEGPYRPTRALVRSWWHRALSALISRLLRALP